jgi:hypothetical protein
LTPILMDILAAFFKTSLSSASGISMRIGVNQPSRGK